MYPIVTCDSVEQAPIFLLRIQCDSWLAISDRNSVVVWLVSSGHLPDAKPVWLVFLVPSFLWPCRVCRAAVKWLHTVWGGDQQVGVVKLVVDRVSGYLDARGGLLHKKVLLIRVKVFNHQSTCNTRSHRLVLSVLIHITIWQGPIPIPERSHGQQLSPTKQNTPVRVRHFQIWCSLTHLHGYT